MVKDKVLFLEKWYSEVGCFCNGANANEAWVRVVGLHLHIWSREVFKLIGDDCGGLIVVNENTNSMAKLQWPRILVKVVVPTGSLLGEGVSIDEDEAGGKPCAACSGSVLEKEFQSKEQTGVQVVSPFGSFSKSAIGLEELKIGHVLWEAHNKTGFGEVSHEIAHVEAPLQGMESKPRPIILKGCLIGCEERPFLLKGSLVGCKELFGMAFGPGVVGLKRDRALYLLWATRDLESLTVNVKVKITNEALVAEASRYDSFLFVFGRDQDIFSSTPSSGYDRALVVGEFSGLGEVDVVEGVGFQAPLSAVFIDGNPWEMEVPGSRWDDSCLAKFNKSLGFTTEGVEWEILKLLLSLKNRRDQGKKKGTLGTTRGAVGGMVVFWDNRVLELVGMEGSFVGFGMTRGALKEILILSDFQMNVEDEEDVSFNEKILGGPFQWGGAVYSFQASVWSLSHSIGWERDKLKALKAILKFWNKDVFGKVWVNKRLALDKVAFWDSQEKCSLSMDELETRKEAKRIIRNELLWRRFLGDKNQEKCDLGDWHPPLDGLDFDRIDVEEAAILDEVFIEEEVFSALSDLNGDKTLNLDGFSLSFWQFCWDFVKYKVMGFLKEFPEQSRFIGWISWCISTAMFSVLTNGTPARFFNSSRGPRQGDPLSPYLFVIDIEALSRLIFRAVRGERYLSGCRINGISGNGVLVSHLLFADDTLVFCEASQDQMVYLSCLLMWFEVISVGRLPTSYLGLSLGTHHKSVAIWDGVEVRFRKRLAMWKRQLISKGERITLIRSTLSKAWLVELWDSSGEDGVWSLRFFKPFNDWEVERLLLTIREGGLILIWKIECYGKRLRMRFLS
ncbi:hypothetical protein CK203_004224 [Vitis vinifera]|uniref:Mitochondrial protein n=1 Tax=Vitis vinifera TaxID=29760 RepID=A0A438K953_VITVI|nr:hypothetical protein CK203_004224 [Vitis vinifera]